MESPANKEVRLSQGCETLGSNETLSLKYHPK